MRHCSVNIVAACLVVYKQAAWERAGEAFLRRQNSASLIEASHSVRQVRQYCMSRWGGVVIINALS